MNAFLLSLRPALREIFPFVAAMLTTALLSMLFSLKAQAVTILALFGIICFVQLSPANGLLFYLFYLSIEGALKMFTHYNPIVHVGSDLILVFVLLRLLMQKQLETKLKPVSYSAIPQVHHILGFMLVFWLWVFVQFLNPWGIGLMPSIAAMKLYLAPFAVFLIVGYLMQKNELKYIPCLLTIIGFYEGAIALLDWYKGPTFLLAFEPTYARINYAFHNLLYRPFGLTVFPGAPSTWMYICLPAVLIQAHRLHLNCNQSFIRRNLGVLLLSSYVLVAALTLLVCQVRINMIGFCLTLIFGLLLSWKRALASLLLAGPLVILLMLSIQKTVLERSDLLATKLELATKRAATLSKQDTWLHSRQFGLGNIFKDLGSKTLLGIGLSRSAASATPWLKEMEKEKYFGTSLVFADDMFQALFTELGLGGLIAYVMLLIMLMRTLWQTGHYEARLITCYCLSVCFVGFGSSGPLYQPHASLFWLYPALAFKQMFGGVSS
ncbi:MAG: hypothetical protein HY537_00905 [Deltaproteobacteria bacterium]|nr:hypothetical protein [Deltaproteobacteria bacterium]